MKSTWLLSVLCPAVLLAAGAAGQQATRPAPASENPQVIEMTARKYAFEPADLHVKRGTKVELRIKALDRTHGFKIDLYPEGSDKKGAPGLIFDPPQEAWRLEKDQVETIRFVASQPGAYNFKCIVFCGFGHGRMHGQLIVEP